VGRLISSTVPTGTVKAYSGTTAPPGYLLCDGSLQGTTLYPELFAVIQYKYGGSGLNFRVPDLKGRVVVGKDDMGGIAANRITVLGSGINGTQLAASGGSETHVLTTAELPAHDHTASATITYAAMQSAVTAVVPLIKFAVESGTSGTVGTIASDSASIDIADTGSNQAHSSTQPSMIMNYIIKY
jgi:microcystin-dependent protein